MDPEADLGAENMDLGRQLSITSPKKNRIQKSFLKTSNRRPAFAALEEERRIREQFAELTKAYEAKKNEANALKSKRNNCLARISEQDTEITDLNAELKAFREVLAAKDREMRTLNGELEDKRRKLEEVTRENSALRAQMDSFRKKQEERTGEWERVRTELVAQAARWEAEVTRLRGSFEKDLKEKSKRTEKTQVSDLQPTSPVAEDKRFLLSNVQDLTFQGEGQVSESYLFQNDPAPFDELAGLSNICENAPPVSPRNVSEMAKTLKGIFEGQKQLVGRNKTLRAEVQSLKGQAKKDKQQIYSLKAFCDSLMDELNAMVAGQAILGKEVANGFRTLENKVIFAKLNVDCEVSLPSNDFGSILETGERPKPRITRNNTDFGRKDNHNLEPLRLLDQFERTADVADKNNRTVDDFRAARRLKRSAQKASLNSHNLRNLMQRSNLELHKETDGSPRLDFEGDIRLEFQPNLCDDLLSRGKNLPRINSFEGFYPAEREDGILCPSCETFGMEMSKFLSRCRTRIADRTETIRYLIDILESVGEKVQATLASLSEPVALLNDFDPFLQSLPEPPFAANPKHIQRIQKASTQIQEGLSQFGKGAAKKAMCFWYEKLKDLLGTQLRNDVYVPQIRQSIEQKFELVDSMLPKATADEIEVRVKDFESRLEKLLRPKDKENTPGNVRSRQPSLEQTQKTFETEERWKKEVQGMVRRFMDKTSQDEDAFSSTDCMTFRNACRGFSERVAANFQQTIGQLSRMLEMRESRVVDRDAMTLSDIYLDQLHHRDSLVGEVWTCFFDSLRSICKEGSVFDSSNRQKLDILTRAADRLLKDFSQNSPYRVSDIGDQLNEVPSEGMREDTEKTLQDLCTATGNLLGSSVRMPPSPDHSIYATFVYPMCFILEFLNIVRK